MLPLLMTESWTNKSGSLYEKFFPGSTMDLVGITIVFLILLIIVLSVFLMSAIIKRKRNGHLAAKPVIRENDGTISSAANGQEAADLTHSSDSLGSSESSDSSDLLSSSDSLNSDYELIAVITAAIAMISSSNRGAGAPYPGFKVRSIKRIRFYHENSF